MKIRTVTMSWGLLAAMVVAPPLLAEQRSGARDHQQAAKPVSAEDQPRTGTRAGAKPGISVGELTQKVLVDNAGNKIANVSSIARGARDNSLQAVIEVAGYYGMSRQELLIPLSKLELKHGQFVAPASVASEEALTTGPRYETARHEVLPDDQMIERSAFAAFEPVRAADRPGEQGQTESNDANAIDLGSANTERADTKRRSDRTMD